MFPKGKEEKGTSQRQNPFPGGKGPRDKAGMAGLPSRLNDGIIQKQPYKVHIITFILEMNKLKHKKIYSSDKDTWQVGGRTRIQTLSFRLHA